MTAHLFNEYADRIENKAEIQTCDDQEMIAAHGSLTSILTDAEDLLARIKASNDQWGLLEEAAQSSDQVIDFINDEINKANEVMREAGHVLDSRPYRRIASPIATHTPAAAE